MQGNEIALLKAGAIARLVIDRVEKRNAMSMPMLGRIASMLAEADADRDIKVIIIQGATEACFASGADIDELVAQADSEGNAWAMMEAVHAAEHAVADCAKPVIAMIRGDCFGGGIEIAMACDLRFASRASRFGVPPAKLGVVYSLYSTKRLVELMGPGAAADLLFSARMFDAEEALSFGLIDRVYAAGDIEGETLAYAEVIAGRSQYSLRAAKEIIRAARKGATEEDARIRQLRVDAFFGPDFREGVAAFREKRSAAFSFR